MAENVRCSCGALFAAGSKFCPLCFAPNAAAGSSNPPTAFPEIDKKRLKKGRVKTFLKNGLWIAALLWIAVNFFAAWGDWSLSRWWSIWPTGAVVLIQSAVFYPIVRKKYAYRQALLLLIAGLGYLFLADWYSDLIISWSVIYAFPVALGIFNAVICIMIAARRRTDPGSSMLALLIIFLFCTALFIMGATILKTVIDGYTLIPVLVAFVVSAVCFGVFTGLKFWELVRALYKKFHI